MNPEPLINLLMVYYKELRSCQKDLLRGEIGLGIFCIKFLVAKSQLIKFFCVFPLFFLFMLDPKLHPNGPFPMETERKNLSLNLPFQLFQISFWSLPCCYDMKMNFSVHPLSLFLIKFE